MTGHLTRTAETTSPRTVRRARCWVWLAALLVAMAAAAVEGVAVTAYPVPPGHNEPSETTEDEYVAAHGPSSRRRQPTKPRIARARRRLETIAISAAVLTFGLLETAHGPALTHGPEPSTAPVRPSTVMDERAFSVPAYQRDWLCQRAGERGDNPLPARCLGVPVYQPDWTTQRAGERATNGS